MESDTRHGRMAVVGETERYHVKGNKKTLFEDCFGKPYQRELIKFAEAALFRLAVSPREGVRTEDRLGRADARFVRVKSLQGTPCVTVLQDGRSRKTTPLAQ